MRIEVFIYLLTFTGVWLRSQTLSGRGVFGDGEKRPGFVGGYERACAKWADLVPGLADDVGHGLLVGNGLPVGPVRGERFVDVRHGEDARFEQNLVALEPARIVPL